MRYRLVPHTPAFLHNFFFFGFSVSIFATPLALPIVAGCQKEHVGFMPSVFRDDTSVGFGTIVDDRVNRLEVVLAALFDHDYSIPPSCWLTRSGLHRPRRNERRQMFRQWVCLASIVSIFVEAGNHEPCVQLATDLVL